MIQKLGKLLEEVQNKEGHGLNVAELFPIV